MIFTIRDLIWASVLVAMIVSRMLDSRDRLLEKIDHRERCLVVERLAHKIDADVHDHLQDVTNRLEAFEGWSRSIDRQRSQDIELQQITAAAIGELQTEVAKLRPAPRPGTGQRGTAAK